MKEFLLNSLLLAELFNNILKSKNTAEHKTKKSRKNASSSYDSSEIHLFKLIQKKTADCKTDTLRKLAACTEDKEETFYILCGWMTEKDAAAFSEEVKTDKNLFVRQIPCPTSPNIAPKINA